jgi:hypothetical protein
MKNAKSGAMSHHYIGQTAIHIRQIADRQTFITLVKQKCKAFLLFQLSITTPG